MFSFEVGQRWIYVLELVEGNYYVGQSDNVNKRIRKHGTKKGAAWTNIYKPICEIIRIDAGICNETEARIIENELTIELMHKYGWTKVRGGDFTNPNEKVIYKKLQSSLERYSIGFKLTEPESVNPKHVLEIWRGINRSKIKVDILKNLDIKLRSTILASISGTFNSKTRNMFVEDIKALDCYEMCNLWFEKNVEKYCENEVPFNDILMQLEKLKKDKINRLQRINTQYLEYSRES